MPKTKRVPCDVSDLTPFDDVVARFGVTPRTLRWYEYMELIDCRRIGRRRYYDARALARFELALRARRFGMRLEDARSWLELYEAEGKDRQYAEWVDIAEGLEAALTEQIADRQDALTELRRVTSRVRKELRHAEKGSEAAQAH